MFQSPNFPALFDPRSKTFLVVSFSALPLPYVWENLQMSTLLMSPGTFLETSLSHETFFYLSAYLDSEQRLVAAKVIKRFILHAKKTGFVVEHDFIMATYLADRWDAIPDEPKHYNCT